MARACDNIVHDSEQLVAKASLVNTSDLPGFRSCHAPGKVFHSWSTTCDKAQVDMLRKSFDKWLAKKILARHSKRRATR